MAKCKVLCIAAGTYRSGCNNIGDIVDIKPGDHDFGPAVEKSFTIYVLNCSVEELKAALRAKEPTDMPDPDEPQKYTDPKYKFCVKDPNAAKLEDKVGTNIALKV